MLGSAGFLMFVMLVAGANLCVGFGVAVYLGVGPKQWPPKFFQKRPPEPLPADEEPADEAEEPMAAQSQAPAADAAEPGQPPQHPFATWLAPLAQGFDRFEAELAAWDRSRSADALDSDALANSAIELKSLADGYLDQFEASLAPLAALSLDDPAAIAAREEIQGCAAELSAELGVACADLATLPAAADPQEASDKLAAVLVRVLDALHGSRDRLEEPLVTLLGLEVHQPALVAMLKDNCDTSLLGRLCFEHVWLAGECYRLSDAVGSVAMIDVDSLRQLTLTHSALAARRALLAVGQMAAEMMPPGALVARLQGKQYLVSLPELSPQAAAEVIERVRQQVEQTRFASGEQAIEVTVSAAVVAVQADDTPTSAIERLRSTVSEAKTYGRNRTFLWEAKAPTPVVPPKLPVAERTIELT